MQLSFIPKDVYNSINTEYSFIPNWEKPNTVLSKSQSHLDSVMLKQHFLEILERETLNLKKEVKD
jgi:hypothetical protein